MLSIYIHMGYTKIFNNIHEVAINQSELIIVTELEWGPKDLFMLDINSLVDG